MARYDDDSYGRDDDDRERRRRVPDDPPPRRDSLISQRLRAARGDAADEGLFDEYDDLPGRRYRSDRGGHAPAPAYGAGGGCAAAVLYVGLGATVVLLLLLLFGRQLLSSLVPNVPQQIQQAVATPTTTVRDRGGTITQIRSLNRLETQSVAVERVVEAKIERGNLLDSVLGERLLLIASGNIVAGVDLAKLKDGDVTVSPDGKSITITLPPSEIFSKSLDNQRTRVYDKQTRILTQVFAGENKDLETQARAAAETEIFNAACETNITQKAADEAKHSMEQLLKLMDFEKITVTGSAGPCVAPGGGPAATTTP